MNDLTLPIATQPSNPQQQPTEQAVNVVSTQPVKLEIAKSIVNKPKSAKRLVSTKDLSHTDWLAVRNTGIGGSDAAAACGLNPYMSMLELWLIKTGRMNPDLSDGLMENAYSPLYWGKELEPLVAKFYTAKTGNKVRRVKAVLQHSDADKSFMLANLDYTVNKSEIGVLEIKTAGEHGAKLWRNGVPLYVTCQVQHQLAVTGKQLAHVCVLICGHESRVFEIKRDEFLIEQLVNLERRFWDYVESDTPPPADASESAAKAIAKLYPNTYVDKVDFSNNSILNRWFNELTDEKKQIDEHQKRFDYLKHQIQQQMKDAAVATFESGSISWKRSKDTIILDSKALLKDMPELLEQYQQVKQGSRRFLVNLKGNDA